MGDIRHGEIWWADLREPRRSEPGFRRPVLVIQGDSFNNSRIGTVIAALITTNLRLAGSPGNVVLPARCCGLPRASVVNVSQVVTLDKEYLTERAGAVPARLRRLVEAGLRLVLQL